MAARARIRLVPVLVVETGDGEVSGRDLGSRKARTLLARLAADRGEQVSTERLAHALWPYAGPADPAGNLATLVSRTRRQVGPGLVVAGTRAYRLADDVGVDLDDARALLDEADQRRAAEPALAAAAARRALDLLGPGGALADEDDADWVLGVRQEADGLRRRARHLLSATAVAVDPAEAVEAARAAVAADPYDEQAVRDLMRALVADGRSAAALAAYAALAGRLREELGTDPDAETSAAHLALLRDDPTPDEPAAPAVERPAATLVGRDGELDRVDARWAAAGSGSGALVVVRGEAGIGKSRLLETVASSAARTGGLVLQARCHPAERSLFLQPWVDALRPVLLALPPRALAATIRGHESGWAALVPELSTLVDAPAETLTTELARRQVQAAVAGALEVMARERPVLVTLDDLQEGATATVDLLGHLVVRLAHARVLLVGAVRTEATDVVRRLGDRAAVLTLGPLPDAAVRTLADRAGLADRADDVLARTRGHTLSVVEFLRALAGGEVGVPDSLAAAVLARVERLDDDAREAVLAGCVLDGPVLAGTLADLVGLDEVEAVRRCERLVTAGLLHRVGARYEFANDLTQACVRQALPAALAAAYHRRAADLLGDRPEAMAVHAAAAGEPARAARGWLLAGQAALDRAAPEDALDLLARAEDAAGDDPVLVARILLTRARVREALAEYADAVADIDAALPLSRRARDRRLEMAVLRARGGDSAVALRQPMAEISEYLAEGLTIASELGDRRAEADFSGRLTVLESARLRLASALRRAEAGLSRARATGSEEAVLLALDALKNVLSYLGDGPGLAEVREELEPALRQRGSVWMLQWTVFETAFADVADEAWDDARGRMWEAIDLNRRSGFTAYAGYFRAHLGWVERLAGDLDAALRLGAEAVAQTSPLDHPWWYVTAAGFHAATLVEAGEVGRARAVAREGLTVSGPDTPMAWRMRCLAPLADEEPEARQLLDLVEAPPRGAWLTGADCYLLVADQAAEAGEPERARRTLEALAVAVTDDWRPVRERVDARLARLSDRAAR